MYKKIILIAIAVVALAACSHDDPDPATPNVGLKEYYYLRNASSHSVRLIHETYSELLPAINARSNHFTFTNMHMRDQGDTLTILFDDERVLLHIVRPISEAPDRLFPAQHNAFNRDDYQFADSSIATYSSGEPTTCTIKNYDFLITDADYEASTALSEQALTH